MSADNVVPDRVNLLESAREMGAGASAIGPGARTQSIDRCGGAAVERAARARSSPLIYEDEVGRCTAKAALTVPPGTAKWSVHKK